MEAFEVGKTDLMLYTSDAMKIICIKVMEFTMEFTG